MITVYELKSAGGAHACTADRVGRVRTAYLPGQKIRLKYVPYTLVVVRTDTGAIYCVPDGKSAWPEWTPVSGTGFQLNPVPGCVLNLYVQDGPGRGETGQMAVLSIQVDGAACAKSFRRTVPSGTNLEDAKAWAQSEAGRFLRSLRNLAGSAATALENIH